MRKYIFLLLLALVVVGAGCSGTDEGTPGDQTPSSTKFGTADWTDYGFLNAFPAGDVLFCTWTHVTGPGPSGNDYPFVLECGTNYIICVAGNMAPDAPYYYNMNTMSYDGDHDVVYVQCTDEAAHGWVFVAWHIAHGGGTTVIRQYLKFGKSGPLDLVSVETQNTVYEIQGISVGGGSHGAWCPTYQMYARVYEMSAPSSSAVDAIAMNPDPDPAAWADWGLVSGDVQDRSGHGRHLVLDGTVQPGIQGPGL